MGCYVGGIGSGQYERGGVGFTAERFKSIDVRRWQRDGLLTPGQAFIWRWMYRDTAIGSIDVSVGARMVTLSYQYTGADERMLIMNQIISLTYTECSYGGERPWFVCPIDGCHKRVAILYGADLFACRHCLDLAYQSQREGAGDRALRRAQAIRMRLGGTANVLEPFPERPKRMRWATYARLHAEAERSLRVSLKSTSLMLRSRKEARSLTCQKRHNKRSCIMTGESQSHMWTGYSR